MLDIMKSKIYLTLKNMKKDGIDYNNSYHLDNIHQKGTYFSK